MKWTLPVAAAWLLIIAPASACAAETNDEATSSTISWAKPGEPRLLAEKELDAILKDHGHDLLVVNFWATWCVPCVQEIPDFTAVYDGRDKTRTQFVGLSADFPDQTDGAVKAFLIEKKVPYPNYVIDIPIDKVFPKFSEKWTGALPATFFFNRQGEIVGEHYGLMTKAELEEEIAKHLKNDAETPSSYPL